jgi:anti-sigma factor RsiW
MKCSLLESQPDWKAYALGELDASARREAESHAAACSVCREELAAMRLTLDAMSTLRDEEIPRRIAFVSDKVFAPKWWQQLWNPTFAAACVVAAAILVHAFMARPGDSALQQAQIDAAVAKAVAHQTAETMAAYEILDKQFKQMYIRTNGIVRQ